MGRGPVVGDLRVQRIERSDGGWSFTIVWADGAVHAEADGFLCGYEGSGTQRTYAYLLVDHLRWLDRACLPLGSVTLRDLERYMGLVGADVRMPLGEPWRAGKRPYGRSALSAAAACLKGFYLHQTSLGVNAGLGERLDRTRLPSRQDRRRAFLGHVTPVMPANPLAPRGPHRRHPKMLPDGARQKLLDAVGTARDRLVVTWLADGGLRIGELCGLHLADLHLREEAACGDRGDQATCVPAFVCRGGSRRRQRQSADRRGWGRVGLRHDSGRGLRARRRARSCVRRRAARCVG